MRYREAFAIADTRWGEQGRARRGLAGTLAVRAPAATAAVFVQNLKRFINALTSLHLDHLRAKKTSKSETPLLAGGEQACVRLNGKTPGVGGLSL